MLGWFVCPTVSMVTTSKATGLEKTPLMNRILHLKHIAIEDMDST